MSLSTEKCDEVPKGTTSMRPSFPVRDVSVTEVHQDDNDPNAVFIVIKNTHQVYDDNAPARRSSTDSLGTSGPKRILSRGDMMRKTVGRSRAMDRSLNTHYWEVHVELSTQPGRDVSLGVPAIKSVVFLLHPTFRNTEVTLLKPPFILKRWGWGEFELGVNVHLEGTEDPLQLVHALNFSQPEATSIFEVQSSFLSGTQRVVRSSNNDSTAGKAVPGTFLDIFGHKLEQRDLDVSKLSEKAHHYRKRQLASRRSLRGISSQEARNTHAVVSSSVFDDDDEGAVPQRVGTVGEAMLTRHIREQLTEHAGETTGDTNEGADACKRGTAGGVDDTTDTVSASPTSSSADAPEGASNDTAAKPPPPPVRKFPRSPTATLDCTSLEAQNGGGLVASGSAAVSIGADSLPRAEAAEDEVPSRGSNTASPVPVKDPGTSDHPTDSGDDDDDDTQEAKLAELNGDAVGVTNTVLGEGSYGTVLEGVTKGAAAVELDSKVALKTYKVGKNQDQSARAFWLESKIVSSLKQHPNIVRLFGVWTSKGIPYLVYELCSLDVGTLLRNVEDGTAPMLSPCEVVDWCLQIARGMSHIHDHRIYHRDLKPQNVLISENLRKESYPSNFRLAIADFGGARDVRGQVSEQSDSVHGTEVGTFLYMAPEVIAASSFSRGSDVWSYAVMMWQLLVGRTPYSYFKGMSGMAIAFQVGSSGMAPLQASWPAPFNLLLQVCFDPDHYRRPLFPDLVKALTSTDANTFATETSERFKIMQVKWFEEISNDHATAMGMHSAPDDGDSEFDEARKPFVFDT
eukprot:m.617931 g.617931  ORF g.617931 m.617931 type:complete len:796 (-) comp22524_c0_seq2:265-2652(-)